MRRWRFGLLLLVLVVPRPAAAQSWAYLTFNPWDPQIPSSTLVEFPLTPAGLGPPQRLIPISRTASKPVVTADGRYVVFVVAATSDAPARVAYLDRLTTNVEFIADLVPSGELFSDPSVVRLFFVADHAITIVEPGGVSSVAIEPIDTRVRPALSADGRELYAVRPRAETSVTYHIVVLDPLTGVEIRSLRDLISTSPINLAVSGDNQRLFVSTSYPNPGVRVLDSHSGVELVSRGPLGGSSIGLEGFGEITVDDRHHRIFVRHFIFIPSLDRSAVVALDASTLSVVSSLSYGRSVAVDLAQGLVVGVGAPADQYERCSPAYAAVWSAPAVPVWEITAPVGQVCPAVVIAAPPRVPANFRSTVEGRQVTLMWDAVPGATGYELGAGSTSGSADLARQLVSATTLVVPDVPPGTYYVRVRALNFVGPSVSSEELVIVVP